VLGTVELEAASGVREWERSRGGALSLAEAERGDTTVYGMRSRLPQSQEKARS
jgi:hypothetical protein